MANDEETGLFGIPIKKPTPKELEELLNPREKEKITPNKEALNPLENVVKTQVTKTIVYYENPETYIAKVLRDKGYRIANLNGVEVSIPRNSHISILEPKRKNIKKTFFGISYLTINKQKAPFIATWYIDYPSKGVNANNWILEVYGRDNVQKLVEIAKEISQVYSVNINVVLAEEKSRLEQFEDLWGF